MGYSVIIQYTNIMHGGDECQVLSLTRERIQGRYRDKFSQTKTYLKQSKCKNEIYYSKSKEIEAITSPSRSHVH
jgi:hypothetical protein